MTMAIVTAKTQKSGETRAAMVLALGKTGISLASGSELLESVISVLNEALSDKNANVRFAAVRGINRLCEDISPIRKSQTSVLMQALEDRDRFVRAAAAEGLSERGDADALREKFGDPESIKPSLEELNKAVEKGDVKACMEAMEKLSSLAEPEAIPHIGGLSKKWNEIAHPAISQRYK